MRRRSIVLALCALAAGPAALHAAPAPASWAQPQIVTVVGHGLLAPDVASFRPDDALTTQDLDTLVGGLTGQPVLATSSSSPVTITTLDARLVRAAGLADVASLFQAGARAAGLAPPGRLGTEAVARLLGLRTNHPAAQDYLEPLPSDPATRAEAAYSAARMLAWTGAQQAYARTAAATFTLPPLSATQREILHTALSFVGFPYVWAGTSEKAEAPAGVQAHGGFDCSGFVLRVYKLQAYPDAPGLAATITGRTTAQIAAEAAPAARIALADLRPADIVLFGTKGPKSKPAQVDHAGIYLGNGWFVHAGSTGVALAPLSDWYKTHFAWGRRPLDEAITPS
jgi:cell wall-associated NlpC family hydrolase